MATSTPPEDCAPGRTRAEHLGPERRRPQILDAALEIAARHGLRAVTVAAIAERLDVTRPVIYAAFKDRAALVSALLEREAEALGTAATGSLYASRGDSPEEAFVRGYQGFLSAVAERPDSWRLLFQDSPDPETVELHRRGRVWMSEHATRWIGPALSAWWSPTDLDRKLPVLIELFLSSCEAAVRSLLDPDLDWTAEELGAFYGRIISAAMAAS